MVSLVKFILEISSLSKPDAVPLKDDGLFQWIKNIISFGPPSPIQDSSAATMTSGRFVIEKALEMVHQIWNSFTGVWKSMDKRSFEKWFHFIMFVFFGFCTVGYLVDLMPKLLELRRFFRFHNNECAICMESGGSFLHLNCSHSFHPDCFNRWRRTRNSCPYCRAAAPQTDEGLMRTVKSLSMKLVCFALLTAMTCILVMI
jgi:hypothetical protein